MLRIRWTRPNDRQIGSLKSPIRGRRSRINIAQSSVGEYVRLCKSQSAHVSSTEVCKYRALWRNRAPTRDFHVRRRWIPAGETRGMVMSEWGKERGVEILFTTSVTAMLSRCPSYRSSWGTLTICVGFVRLMESRGCRNDVIHVYTPVGFPFHWIAVVKATRMRLACCKLVDYMNLERRAVKAETCQRGDASRDFYSPSVSLRRDSNEVILTE